ncbi:KedN5 family methylcobalamin-dependent radical SAM C-methyltransferase [Actinokineospora fastidiosa]|uniref:Uncharacterized protein n=1 Tax=Actinokineospora fastidiosa TaxID=1816 RepID=A0A918LE91_9PSEU|nr:KedN5 family methylcobalamin-dependent radical SAM C-methyltransferase [Actinokineospora fastidiosa]GGS35195.1 hypothetical protein GCM10010171_32210 [Actinokineospora fastidiosa]
MGAFSVVVVQQGVWHMAKESMPLAAGYLTAAVRQDPELAGRCDTGILNFPGTASPWGMAVELVRSGVPDVVGFSVLGWNVRQFSAVAEAVKQAAPGTLVVFGGNHVAHQAERVFRQCPAVDVVVNGEGEAVFVDIVRTRLAGRGFHGIAGISYRAPDDTVVTTPERPRRDDLDELPSPILTGAIPLRDDDGGFRYDVALMETNRGCPYRCAFCYWGGAVGQKVRAFSRDRLRAELTALAEAGADTIVLCDANFGMLRQDADFVDDLISVRRQYGYPRALETSWAKNKSATFFDIVRTMKREGLRSSFTLALQTLDDATLLAMNRRNMRINSWHELADWLAAEGLDTYAELIWGAPGESPESFLRGYDELARRVSRIAAYPLLLLPNTAYTEDRGRHGFITVRGDRDDFEYVLATREISLAENLRMQRFLFWARLLAENLVLRSLWPVAGAVLGMGQSALVLSVADHIDGAETPGARLVRAAADGSVADPDSLAPALEFCFSTTEFDDLLMGWWAGIEPRVPAPWRVPLREVLRHDLDTRPLPDPARRGLPDAELVGEDGDLHWSVERTYLVDVPALARAARLGRLGDAPAPSPHRTRLRFKRGFAELARSTNHEETAHYVATTTVRAQA